MTHAFSRAVFAAAAIAFAFTVAAQDKKGGAKLSAVDRSFIMQAADGGMAEVELGKLAQQKGASNDVKQFGQRMVQDHGKANKELETIATKLGVTPPKQVSGKHQADMKKLSKLTGEQFDREYAQHMVMDHEKTVALFQQQASKGQAEELKAFVSKTLPTLQEHLKMARSLAGQKK
jgi:putative membrane protein